MSKKHANQSEFPSIKSGVCINLANYHCAAYNTILYAIVALTLKIGMLACKILTAITREELPGANLSEFNINSYRCLPPWSKRGKRISVVNI